MSLPVDFPSLNCSLTTRSVWDISNFKCLKWILGGFTSNLFVYSSFFSSLLLVTPFFYLPAKAPNLGAIFDSFFSYTHIYCIHRSTHLLSLYHLLTMSLWRCPNPSSCFPPSRLSRQSSLINTDVRSGHSSVYIPSKFFSYFI